MAEQSPPARPVLLFDRFALAVKDRTLTRDGVPIELGGRTLDTLIALATHPNQVLSKRELMSLVWPDVTVEEGSLRFHIAVLRKALGDGPEAGKATRKTGGGFITTLAGRGYCFVAPVTLSPEPDRRTGWANRPSASAAYLPARLAHLVGREHSVAAISERLRTSRFVTIVGPGGVGKTAVALTIAHNLMTDFWGAVLFVDLSQQSDPAMVPAAMAAMLDMSVQSNDPLPSLIAMLRERRMLVILDNCEHVIDGAARVAARLLPAAPQLVILATSREALRADGEQVFRLAPLAAPPNDPALTVHGVLGFPAAQLFVERASASGTPLCLDEQSAAIVGEICRKLDGMALAIELVAARVDAWGLQQTASLLDDRFALSWPGKRTAPERQKTLRATFDWSYRLLSEPERLVFRSLAVFAGSFTIDAALVVVTGVNVDAAKVFAAIDSLVAKSMITAIPTGAMMRYRLLDTARACALETITDAGERTALAARHAAYCLRWLGQFMVNAPPLLDSARRASNLADLNNVRAALAWAFGPDGDGDTSIRLAVAAAPVFFAMSLLIDCRHWSQLAIAALDDTTVGRKSGGRPEMRLQSSLALSLMWTLGNHEATSAALNRSIAIARELNDPVNQMMLLAPLHVLHLRKANFRQAMTYAEQANALARTSADQSCIDLSRILLGFSFHFAGDLAAAQRELNSALQHHPLPVLPVFAQTHAKMIDDAMASPILVMAWAAAPSALARTLWLLGDPAAALEYVDRTIADAARANHPVTQVVAVMYAISVLIWNGDLDVADGLNRTLIAMAKSYGLEAHLSLGRCFEGQLAIGRGDFERGSALLQDSLLDLRQRSYGLLNTSFTLSQIEALVAVGRIDDAADLVAVTLAAVEKNGDYCYLPELLRLKARVLEGLPNQRDEDVEAVLAQSLAASRRQGALAWELRTSIDCTKGLAARAQVRQAHSFLTTVCDRFAAGSDTADLRTARTLLARWA